MVPSNFGCAIAIRDSALRRHLIVLIADIIDCCTVHLLMSAGVDALVLVVARPVRSGQSAATIKALPAGASLALPFAFRSCMYAIWRVCCVM